jgi:hypothetical protein
MADDDGGGALFSRLRNINRAFKHAGGSAQKKFTVLGWKFPWLLNCPGFCHDLLRCLVEYS